jgi:site-specific DNA-cytosine methylase
MGTGGNNVPIVQVLGGQHPNAAMDEEKSPTLTEAMGSGGGHVPIINDSIDSVAYNITFCDANGTRKDRVDGGCYVNETDKSNTITATGTGTSIAYSIREDAKANNFSATELDVANAIQAHQPSTQSHHAQTFIAETITFPADMNFRPNFEDGVSNTLLAKGNMSVAMGVDTYNGTLTGQTASTMTADMASASHTGPKVYQNMAVRRLTPKECERLQGFPDNYTQVPWRKGESPDGVRYKALGNSMAVPVMRWIGERIHAYSQR